LDLQEFKGNLFFIKIENYLFRTTEAEELEAGIQIVFKNSNYF
jgi:hypothetical protein